MRYYNMTSKFQKSLVQDILRGAICEVTFTKVNGEERKMNCTLSRKIIPESQQPEHWLNPDLKPKKQSNPNTLSVFSTDENTWKSFRVDNLTQLVSKEMIK